MPLLFVPNIVTARCHPGFGDVGRHWIAHTKGGWMTAELLTETLHPVAPPICQAFRADPVRSWPKADAVRTIINAWEEVGMNVVISAWRCVLPAGDGE